MKNFSINFTPPLGVIVAQLLKNPTFLSDVSDLLSFSNEEFDYLKQRLRENKELLSPESMKGVFAELVDGKKGSSIARIVSRLSNAIDDLGENRESAIEQVTSLMKSQLESLEVADREKAADRVRDLLNCRGVKLHRKVKLLESMGNEVDGADFICDLRPVFDLDSDEVVGLIPIVTLFLDIEGNSKPQVLRLSEAMLQNFRNGAERAAMKIESLKKLSKSNNLLLPIVSGNEN